MAATVVAVHCATGLQGSHAARRLLEDGFDVRLVIRNPQRAVGLPEGCERVRGDLLDSDSLAAAYRGVDAVALQFPLIFDDAPGDSMTTAVIHALAEAQVGHVILNTGILLPPQPIGIAGMDFKVRAVQQLLDSPVPTTVLQPGVYMENLAEPWSARPIVEEGVVKYMLPGEVAVPWVTLDDVAAVASKAIKLGPNTTGVFPVIGPELLTGFQVADILSSELARPVRWEYVPPTQYADMVRPYIGDHAADGVARAYERMATMEPPPPPDYEPTADVFSLEQTSLHCWASRASWGDDASGHEPIFRRTELHAADPVAADGELGGYDG